MVGPLATEVGICGQIDGNPLVIQGDLATDRGAEMLRNPCLRAVMLCGVHKDSVCRLSWLFRPHAMSDGRMFD